jgi:hypothetical protein
MTGLAAAVMETSISKPEQWNVKDFRAAFDENGIGLHYITIPRFQRSLVWSEEQRRKLIDSLYRGYPIGAILGYQTGKKEGTRNVIQIVDGLQRTTAINEYLKAPLYFAPVDRVFSEHFVSEIVRSLGLQLGSDSNAMIYGALESWMKEVKVPKMGAAFSLNSLISHLATKFVVEKSSFNEFVDLINNELGEVQDRVRAVETVAIPIVLYSGDVSHIPEIFERINNQGTKLSKYEILASSWVSSQTKISNPKIREAIADKYNVLIKRGFEIDGLPEGGTIDIDKFNLYEYLFGLGKALEDDHGKLFGNSGDPDESTPTAFVLLTTAFGLRNNKMNDLYSVIRNLQPGALPLDFSGLESALFKSRDEIWKALAPYLSLKMHKRDSTDFVGHSQNQILSLIGAYLVNAFDLVTWKPRPDSEMSVANAILKNAASHYLFDMLSKRWRGSGDSRLFEMVWSGSDSSLTPSSYYSQPIQAEAIKAALRDWHEDQLAKRQKERPNVTATAQTVLLFLYAGLVVFLDDKQDQYELEHLFPVAVLSKRILETPNDEGWPISALGNLTLLPKDINRIKGKHMLGDFLPTLIDQSEISQGDLEKIQRYLITPDWQQITMANLKGKEDYLQFCRLRLDSIAEEVCKNLKLS